MMRKKLSKILGVEIEPLTLNFIPRGIETTEDIISQIAQAYGLTREIFRRIQVANANRKAMQRKPLQEAILEELTKIDEIEILENFHHENDGRFIVEKDGKLHRLGKLGEISIWRKREGGYVYGHEPLITTESALNLLAKDKEIGRPDHCITSWGKTMIYDRIVGGVRLLKGWTIPLIDRVRLYDLDGLDYMRIKGLDKQQ